MSESYTLPAYDPVYYEPDGTFADEYGRSWVLLAKPSESQPFGSVLWTCPLCRRGYFGELAAAPVSGWDAPRWRATVAEGRLTLEPSLGCRGMQDGSCPGHWWVRDGKLMSA